MHSVKEKVSNAAAAAKEHVDIFKANTQEKVSQFKKYYYYVVSSFVE